uniref:BPTI/Kunitz inhibitor domain-containing protein n=1 Tax=Caenorhabditis japonica TaxID=281687 RepID=A0A8R1EKT4_CAEJA
MLAFLFFSVLLGFITAHGPGCFLPLVPGTSIGCKNAPSLRYHFDPDLNVCHTFHYNGCGGNINNYKTPGDCYKNCVGDPSEWCCCTWCWRLPSRKCALQRRAVASTPRIAIRALLQPFFLPGKYFQCSLGKKPIFNNNGSPTCPLSDTGDGCDSDAATCVNLYTMGLCCNKTVEFGFAADQTATCLSGKSRYQLDGKSVLAKICDDLTCPNGYSCEQGNFFVSCCQD